MIVPCYNVKRLNTSDRVWQISALSTGPTEMASLFTRHIRKRWAGISLSSWIVMAVWECAQLPLSRSPRGSFAVPRLSWTWTSLPLYVIGQSSHGVSLQRRGVLVSLPHCSVESCPEVISVQRKGLRWLKVLQISTGESADHSESRRWCEAAHLTARGGKQEDRPKCPPPS